MNKLVVSLSSFLLASAGWWIGAFAGPLAAFVVSMIGTGVGIYAGKKIVNMWDF